MKIEVLKRIDHKGCPIYIRKLDTLFEYLIIYKGELYSSYFNIKPSWYRRHYTEQQIEDIVKLVLMTACKVIDALKKKK